MEKEVFMSKGREAVYKIRQIIRRGNAIKIVVRDKNDKVLLSLPSTLVAAGSIMAPLLAGASLVLALVQQCKIEVIKKESKETNEEPEERKRQSPIITSSNTQQSGGSASASSAGRSESRASGEHRNK